MFIYYVSATISSAEMANLPIFKIASPVFNELKLRSKQFDGYKECIDQAQRFITDIALSLNQAGGNYFVQIGRNPDFCKDSAGEEEEVPGIGQLAAWHNQELCRYYLLDASQKDPSGVFFTKLVISILTHQTTKGN